MQPSLVVQFVLTFSGAYPMRMMKRSFGEDEGPVLGEIGMFSGNYAPAGTIPCDGQLLPISVNPALFSVLGTLYGGNGMITFAAPDFRGRAAAHVGESAPLSSVALGSRFGTETVTLNVAQLANHAHTFTQLVSVIEFQTLILTFSFTLFIAHGYY